MNYDVLIPSCPKDYKKLPYVIQSILDYLTPQPDNIFVAAPHKFTSDVTIWVNEKDIIPDLDISKIKFKRPMWIYQQLLKLFQQITSDIYLVVDSDLILNRPLDIFNKDKKRFFFGVDQNHQPYFNLMRRLFNIGREYHHSFINEIMLFDRNIISEMIPDYREFFDTICDIIQYDGNDYLLSEYELYGNYVTKYHPDLYEHVHITSILDGKYSDWTDEDIQKAIDSKKAEDCDMFTLHTWI